MSAKFISMIQVKWGGCYGGHSYNIYIYKVSDLATEFLLKEVHLVFEDKCILPPTDPSHANVKIASAKCILVNKFFILYKKTLQFRIIW